MHYTTKNNPSEQMREVRGYAIISKGDSPNKIGKNTYSVPSQNDNGEYVVKLGRKSTCTCPDYEKRELPCKHIYACRFFNDFNNKVKTEYKGIVKGAGACPYCKSTDTIGAGKRITKTGQKQRYECKGCGKKFVEEKDYERYKGSAKATTIIMDLYFKGLSSRGISDHLKQFYSLSLDHSNIIRRIHKFSAVIEEYVKTLKPEVASIWNHDEMKIQAGGQWLWLWNCLDSETKYLITTQVSVGARQKDSDDYFRKVREQTKASPEYVLTDGRHTLTASIKKAMPTAHHVKLTSLTDKRQNNQQVERLNGTIRDRIRPMRGFQEERTAEIMTSAYRNYYNFVKPHSAIGGLTPAQAAGIGVEEATNKWGELLRRSFEGKN